MGTGKRRSTAQLVRDRRRIADLYLQGWIQADIASEVNLSQATVSRDLSVLHTQWLRSSLIDFDQVKAQELAKIDRLEREYWDAWEQSCLDAETITEKGKAARGAQKPDQVEKIVQRRGQSGDPRFLAGVQWCIEKRCKIFGLDAPEKWEVDWRREAEEAGLDPSMVFERYVQAAAAAIAQGQSAA
jgi:hypothetical protein